MALRQPHYSQQAFDRRGDESDEAQLHPKVKAGNHRGIMAIDFEVDARAIVACVRTQMRKSSLLMGGENPAIRLIS
jgi:hypothetical protein